MTPYFEFYSDLDLILRNIEELIDKCQKWWISDTPFTNGEEKVESSYQWRLLQHELIDILDILNDEPFFTSIED